MKLYREPNQTTLEFEKLEPRQLLAGDIRVFIQDSILLVVGDDQPNQVRMTQAADGGITISGDDTTINSGDQPVTISRDFRYITIATYGGNDTATVQNYSAPHNLNFFGGNGDDGLILDSVSARHMHLDGETGNDTFDIRNAAIRHSTYFYLGAGDDVVGMTSARSGWNFKVFGGGGNDTFAARELSVGGKLELHLEDGNDTAFLAGQTSASVLTKINLGDGNDSLLALPSQTAGIATLRQLRFDGGTGDDVVVTDQNVILPGYSRLDGNDGTDTIQGFLPGSRGIERVINFQSRNTANPSASLEDVYATLGNAGFDTSIFGATLQTIDVVFSTDTLSFVEGADPVSIDPALQINSSGVVRPINRATVQLDNFNSGQDVLAFNDTGSITSRFDPLTGILSLSGIATPSAYQEALRGVTYQNTSDAPVSDDRTLHVTVVSGSVASSDAQSLRVIGVNDAPSITLSVAALNITAVDLPVIIDPDLEIQDVDSPQLASAVVAIATGFESGRDVLGFTPQTGIIGTFDPSTGALTLSGNVDIAEYQTVLSSITFNTSTLGPDLSSKTIRYTINDGLLSDFDEVELQFDTIG